MYSKVLHALCFYKHCLFFILQVQEVPVFEVGVPGPGVPGAELVGVVDRQVEEVLLGSISNHDLGLDLLLGEKEFSLHHSFHLLASQA